MMDDRVAFRIGARHMYNRVLWQMLQRQETAPLFDITFPVFDLPMHTGVGFQLIHLWENYWRYGKSKGQLHKFAETSRRMVGYYE